MAVKIIGTSITMTRGDTLKTKINILDSDGNEYVPTNGDYIRFAMKKKYTDDTCCILKEIPIDTLVLHLEPQDTKCLPQPCEYVYDIQITMADGTVDTFITGKLSIIQEVE